MTTVALVVGESPAKLWHLNSQDRIARQLKQSGKIQLLESEQDIPENAQVLLLSAHFLYEVRTLSELLQRRDSLLRFQTDSRPAAAMINAADAADILTAMRAPMPKEHHPLPEHLSWINVSDLGAFDHQLRKAKPPLLEPITAANHNELESLLYGTAYKGITDLVTKFVWPKPARVGVQICARFGLTPNLVTTVGFLLMLAACYLFSQGQYAAGLLAGWIMTYLDTVDGKLARVTIKSSKFGHLFDHGMDIIHPPFWYVYWGSALISFTTVYGLTVSDLNLLIIGGYIGGRLLEMAFHLLGHCSIFSWRPLDAYFRLVTARRNPCMILLTASLFIGRPDWGFIAVALWTVASTALMALRLLQGLLARLRYGPLESWLKDPERAAENHPKAYQTFSGTQSAYAVSRNP